MPSSQLAAPARRLRVTRLYLQGCTDPEEIAARLSLAPPEGPKIVRRDLTVIKRGFKKLAKEDAEAMRAMEAAKLAHLEREALKAWNRSKRGKISTKETREPSRTAQDATSHGEAAPVTFTAEGGLREHVEGLPVAPPQPVLAVVEEVTARESSAGDPRFLAQAADCIKQRRELFNLDVPKKVDPNAAHGMSNVNITHVTIEQFNQLPMHERLLLSREGRVRIEESSVEPISIPAVVPGTDAAPLAPPSSHAPQPPGETGH